MSKPTVKQVKFASNYLKTGNATQAYRESRDASGMKATTQTRNAHRELGTSNIRAMVESGLLAIRSKGELERSDIEAMLLTAADIALRENDGAGSSPHLTQASTALAKICGLEAPAIHIDAKIDLSALMNDAAARLTIDHKSDQESIEASAHDSHEDKIEQTVNK